MQKNKADNTTAAQSILSPMCLPGPSQQPHNHHIHAMSPYCKNNQIGASQIRPRTVQPHLCLDFFYWSVCYLCGVFVIIHKCSGTEISRISSPCMLRQAQGLSPSPILQISPSCLHCLCVCICLWRCLFFGHSDQMSHMLPAQSWRCLHLVSIQLSWFAFMLQWAGFKAIAISKVWLGISVNLI